MKTEDAIKYIVSCGVITKKANNNMITQQIGNQIKSLVERKVKVKKITVGIVVSNERR